MDEQDPRVGGEQIRGRGDEEFSGHERPARARRTSTAGRTSADTTRSRRPTAPGAAADETGSTEPTEVRTEELREEIERTREDMSETVNAIQERLRPSTIASNAAERVKDNARQTARYVAESEPVMIARSNPIPVAMVGIGIAGLTWLAMNRRNQPAYRWGSYRRTPDWRTMLDESRATRSGYDEGGPAAVYAARSDSWRDERPRMGRTATGRIQQTWNESPLLIGAGCAVLGAIIGFAVPETERENELMGEARDNMVESVQGAVRDRVNKVQEAATDAIGTVQDAAKNAVGLPSTDEPDRL